MTDKDKPMTLPPHPHIGRAVLCSCPACCLYRLASARRVFTAQGDTSQAEAAHLVGDYDHVGSYQRSDLGD